MMLWRCSLVLCVLLALVGAGCASVATPNVVDPPSAGAGDGAATTSAPPSAPATEAPNASTTAPPTSTAAPTTEAPAGLDLDGLVAAYLGDADGGVDVLVQRDGELSRATAGTATSEGTPINQGDAFRVGSLSKPFVATMVLQLVDEGQIALDAPLGDYLGELAVGADVTIAQLLSHQSGIANYTEQQAFFLDAMADPARELAPSEIIDYVRDSEVVPDPTFAYSNTNYILLGQLIERIDDQPLNDSLALRIVRPLGLESTSFALAGTPNPPTAPWSRLASMTGEGDVVYDAIASGAWAAGALLSNVDDLSTFLAGLFGGQLLSDESLAAMVELGPSGYGLGIQEVRFGPNQTGFGHGGAIFGYLSTMAIDPTSGDRIIVVTNNDELDPELLAIEVLSNW